MLVYIIVFMLGYVIKPAINYKTDVIQWFLEERWI